MNVKTEARNEISTQEMTESNDNDRAPAGSHGSYWILTVVLVAVAGLITALVIESSNSSSSSDVKTPAITTLDPQFDQDVHRAPPVAASASVNQAHREADLFPAAASAASVNQAHREADLFPAGQVTDPRQDADHHRDPNGTD